MPTNAGMKVPPPKSWEEFQEITLSALRQRWHTSNLHPNGRSGQTQHGVDIFGDDDLGRAVGIQCKNTETITIAQIKKECDEAEGFTPKLAAFYIATSVRRDATIQSQVRIESGERLGRGSFPVGILFWEDLIVDLASNTAEFHKHYPQLSLDLPGSSGYRLLCIFDFAYFGTGLKKTVDLIFGEFGFMAQENPFQINSLVASLEAASRPLMTSERHGQFVDLGVKLVSSCHAADWTQVENLLVQMQGLVDSVEYDLRGREAAAFRCGFLISRWANSDWSKGTAISGTLETEIEAALTALLPGESVLAKAREFFAKSRSDDSILTTALPHDLFNEVRRVLTRENMASAGTSS